MIFPSNHPAPASVDAGLSGPSSPGRGRFDATVEINRQICREHYLLRLRLHTTFPATQPGQFIQLGCRPPQSQLQADESIILGQEYDWNPSQIFHPHQAELCQPLAFLRRPFSLAGRGDDSATTWLEIVHRVVGTGTQWLSALSPGSTVDLIGPLGNAFTLPSDKSLALLVGGGVGLPPMFYLAQALRACQWDAVGFVGALTHDLLAVDWQQSPSNIPSPWIASWQQRLPQSAQASLLRVKQFSELGYPTVITTNDGSSGIQGLITAGLQTVLDQLSPSDIARCVVFTCGPEPMMHAVADCASKYQIPCQVCMEQAMACGMGTCQSCVVKIDPQLFQPQKNESPHATTSNGRPWRYKLACTDGPVFDSKVVVW